MSLPLRFPWLALALSSTCLWRPVAALTRVSKSPLDATHGTQSLEFLAPKAALEQVHAAARQGPVTTHETWFERMGDAFMNVVFGIVLIIFSFPVLWVNESRNAKTESLLSYAASHARTVGGKVADRENRDCLVHLQGEQMKAAAPVSDRQFDVTMAEGYVQLISSIEVFQVVEHKSSRQRDTLGGGRDTTTSFRYSNEWSSVWHASGSYNDRRMRINQKPPGLELGTHTQKCTRVEYGQGFLLTDDLVQQCSASPLAPGSLGESVTLKAGNLVFHRRPDGWYYHSGGGPQGAPAGGGAPARHGGRGAQHGPPAGGSGPGARQGSPAVGDARVRFTCVPDGPASVIALQVAAKDGGERDTFLPYRLIPRGLCCCGLSEEEEKRRLHVEAEKTSGQLAREAGCPGALACLCCACDLVARCFAGALTPEVHHLFHGSRDATACLRVVQSRTRLMTIGMRFAGWIMMFVGLYALFTPFLTLIEVIPYLGPILSSVGGWLIWILCLFFTVLLSSAVIVAAYLIYHPLLALLYAVVAGGIVGAVVALVGLMQ